MIIYRKVEETPRETGVDFRRQFCSCGRRLGSKHICPYCNKCAKKRVDIDAMLEYYLKYYPLPNDESMCDRDDILKRKQSVRHNRDDDE